MAGLNYADFSEKIILFVAGVKAEDCAQVVNRQPKTQFVGPARSVKCRNSSGTTADLSAVELLTDLRQAIKESDWRQAYVNYLLLKRLLNQ